MGFTEFFFTGLYRDGMACRAACVFQKDNWRSLSVSSFIFFLLVSSNERVGSEMAFLASDSGCEPHPQARPFFLIIFFYRVYWVFEHFEHFRLFVDFFLVQWLVAGSTGFRRRHSRAKVTRQKRRPVMNFFFSFAEKIERRSFLFHNPPLNRVAFTDTASSVPCQGFRC